MPAGHDFDALLIGALYGELSAVEESRLQAHLAAHPSDHEIFRQLTRTREAIRASAALAIVEPPQAISALLLQEAARRVRGRTAEIRAAASEKEPSRWMRWLASLMAHPGLAAAAMAVLVVGVFGSLYLRDKHEVAEAVLAPAAPASGSAMGGDTAAAPSAAPAAALSEASGAASPAAQAQGIEPAADPSALGSGSAWSSVDLSRAPSPADEGSVARASKQDSYSVALDDSNADSLRQGVAKNQAAAKPAVRPGYIEAKPVPNDIALKEYDETRDAKRKDNAREEALDAAKEEKRISGDDAERMVQRRAAAPSTPAQAPKAEVPEGRVAAGSYDDDDGDIADSRGGRRQEPEREKAEDRADDKPAKKSVKTPTKPVESVDQSAAAQDRTVRLADAPAGPSPATTRAPADGSVKGASGGATNAVSGAGKISPSSKGAPGSGSSAASAPRASAPAAPSPAPPAVTVAEPITPAESVSVVDKDWAKREHVRLVRLVRENKCTDAARVARAIAEGDPRYYQDKVAGTSALRVCEAVIRDQLNQSEQAKRKRAAPARAADEAKRK